jgi:hypothetical protein
MNGMARIENLDHFMREITADEPVPLPDEHIRQYKLHVAPDVYTAIREADSGQQTGFIASPFYGVAEVKVTGTLGSGEWILRRDGRKINAGNINTQP